MARSARSASGTCACEWTCERRFTLAPLAERIGVGGKWVGRLAQPVARASGTCTREWMREPRPDGTAPAEVQSARDPTKDEGSGRSPGLHRNSLEGIDLPRFRA